MERLFRIVNRINNVLFMLLVLLVGGFILFEIASSTGWEHSGEVTAVETGESQSREVKLRFGEATRVFGAATLMLPLLGTEESEGFIGSKSEYGEVRNELFVKPDGSASWLFTGNGNRIFEANQVPATEDLKSYRAYDPDQSDQGPTKLLLIGFVAPEDGLPERHLRTPMRIALAKPDGSGLVEVLKDVDSILSYWLSPSGDRTIIYQSEATVHRAHYALDGFRKISNTAIAEIPKTL